MIAQRCPKAQQDLVAHLRQSKGSVVAQNWEPQEEGQDGNVHKGELLAHEERPVAVKAPLQPPQLLPQCISSLLLPLGILPAHACSACAFSACACTLSDFPQRETFREGMVQEAC